MSVLRWVDRLSGACCHTAEAREAYASLYSNSPCLRAGGGSRWREEEGVGAHYLDICTLDNWSTPSCFFSSLPLRPPCWWVGSLGGYTSRTQSAAPHEATTAHLSGSLVTLARKSGGLHLGRRTWCLACIQRLVPAYRTETIDESDHRAHYFTHASMLTGLPLLFVDEAAHQTNARRKNQIDSTSWTTNLPAPKAACHRHYLLPHDGVSCRFHSDRHLHHHS